MIIHFGYDKKQVLQALRYHFITRPEIKDPAHRCKCFHYHFRSAVLHEQNTAALFFGFFCPLVFFDSHRLENFTSKYL